MQTEAEISQSKKSTQDKIKEMFLAGQIMTSCGTAGEFITADLRKYVSLLRRSGLDIMAEWVKSENGKHFKRYWLKKPEPIMPGQQQLNLL